MPRTARLVVPGMPMHIVQRGNNRGPCFFSDGDRWFYLCQLEEHAERFECAVHAYCLMDNHVHLLLTPGHHQSAAQLMKKVGQRHTQYINRVYRRTGTLWEGRFRSCLVESERYLFACHRYIENNPVRAGMVSHPAHYEWSSYRFNAEGRTSRFISPRLEFLALGKDAEDRCRNYRTLFCGENASSDDEIRKATNGGHALGGEVFRKEMRRLLGGQVGPGQPGRPRAPRRLGGRH